MNKYKEQADRVMSLHSQGINLRAAQSLAEAQATVVEQRQAIKWLELQVRFLALVSAGLVVTLCVLIEEYVV